MIRFGFEQYGAPTVFQTLTAAKPEPKAGQVQLEVLGFGLNPYDASLRRGEQAAFRHLKWPIVPGTDVVGRVTQLGAGVSGLALGDVVINYRPLGGYSEYVTASVGKVIKKPAPLSLAQAAGLPQVGVAAYTIMRQLLTLKPGQTIAVIGASGGVGVLVVQLARAQQLHVIAVASRRNQAGLTALGATTTAAYDDPATTAALADQADATVNAVNGGQDHGLGARLTKPGGTLITTAYATPATGGKALNVVQLGALAKAEAALPALAALAASGQLTVRIAAQFPFSLAGVIAGHEQLETHHAPGKLVVLREDLD